MLQIYAGLTEDENINKIIKSFINDRILNIIQFHLDMNMYGTLDSIVGANTEDPEFYEYITEDISPENVSETDANAAFISLIELLRSDHVLEPSMLQNYQMFQLIAGYCDLAKDMDLELVEKFPARDRKNILKALEPIAKESGCPVELIIDDYENLEHYKEICFEDWDFLQLDNMTFDELKASEANEFLGMIGDNEILGMKAQVLRFPNGLGKGEE